MIGIGDSRTTADNFRFCVNSLAHWLGEQPFDDRRTPRDHFITALVTLGEGYHNFHHEFPSDYRKVLCPNMRLFRVS